MKRRFLTVLFKYGLGVGLLTWVIWRNWSPSPDGSSPGIAGVLQRPIQLLPLAAAFLCCLASISLTFVRWYVLVRAQALPFSVGNALRLGYVGYFFSTFFPGSVGGDIVKAYYLAREQSRRTVAVATVLVDRGVGLWALFWLLAIAGGLSWINGIELPPILQQVVLLNFGLIAVTTLLWSVLLFLPRRNARRFTVRLKAIPRIGHSVAELWRAIWMYRNQWRSVILALGMSIVSHCGFVLSYYFAAQTFQSSDLAIPSLAQHFVMIPIGMGFQGFIPTPGGIGGGELVFGVLYALWSFPEVDWTNVDLIPISPNGVIGSLSYRMITWVLGLVGFGYYLHMKPQLEEAEAELEELAA